MPNGSTIDFGGDYVAPNDVQRGAMWCFQHMNLAWNVAACSGTWPGFIGCAWPWDNTHQSSGNIYVTYDDSDAADIVNHEYGHALMYRAYDGWWPLNCDPRPHYFDQLSCLEFAWTEGWASFVALAAIPDGRFHFEPDRPGTDLED